MMRIAQSRGGGTGPDRRNFLSCAAHMLMLATAAPLRAARIFAPARGHAVVAREPWGRIERVAEGVWAMISTPLLDRTTVCNGGIVRGSSGVLLIESFARAEGASWFAQKTRELTGRWPDDVVLTHYHSDHTAGTTGYLREDGAPRLRVTAVTRDMVKQADARRNETLDARRTGQLADALLVDGANESVIDLGERRVHIIPRDGHTRSDVTIELDEPSVVFCGDLVWNQMFPNYVDAIPSRLSYAVNSLTRERPTVYVPGHGPLAHSTDLWLYANLLDSVYEAARNAKERGQSAAQAAAEYRLPRDVAQWTLFNPQYFETAIGAWLKELGAD